MDAALLLVTYLGGNFDVLARDAANAKGTRPIYVRDEVSQRVLVALSDGTASDGQRLPVASDRAQVSL